MALLYRATRLRDRADTRVLTFVITRSVTRDLERDVTSKEFNYGYHKWAITFSRTDKVLGVYLVWKSACEGVRVYVDFTFTLLNREHFTSNEGFSGKQVRFTSDAPAHGSRSCIPVPELHARTFTDRRGEFQLELTLSSVRTVFMSDLRLPAHRHSTAGRTHSTGSIRSHRMESTYFTYGGFDWNVSLAADDASESRLVLLLNRLTGFDHICRVKYTASLGEMEKRLESGPIDDLSDSEGRVQGWHPRGRLQDFVQKGAIRVTVELFLARTVCDISIPLTLPNVTSTSTATVARAIQCYDRDKQAWAVRADCYADAVRLHLLYKDVHNVPRNHLRCVSWNASLIRGSIADPLPGSPQSHYYAQESTDDGLMMETDLPVAEVRAASCPYLDELGALRIRIEWEDTYLLFQATYHRYDDVSRIHNFQMRKEIAALQAENYSLERQLFSYQKSLAYAQAQGGYADSGATPDYDERAYSVGERSLSTDTEYA